MIIQLQKTRSTISREAASTLVHAAPSLTERDFLSAVVGSEACLVAAQLTSLRLAEEFRISNDGVVGSTRRHCGAPMKGQGIACPNERYRWMPRTFFSPLPTAQKPAWHWISLPFYRLWLYCTGYAGDWCPSRPLTCARLCQVVLVSSGRCSAPMIGDLPFSGPISGAGSEKAEHRI